MTKLTLRGRVLLVLLALTAGVALADAHPLPAQSTGCVAYDRNFEPRACTFLESHGQCLWNALDSYYACVDEHPGLLGRLGCEVGAQFDVFACNLALPWRVIKTILQ